MSESFQSVRFGKRVWLTNYAIESMAKRDVTLREIMRLIEEGEYRAKGETHGWIFRHFPERDDNLMCAAVANKQTIIVKTVMIDWKQRI
uniref:DUF4258 domain-containing protein n=1 Tax=Candidatus Kentrum sp. SD TaxID=2126332 RepID=A0A450Y6F7_9GAMM|nr:MAG: protein of unknown function (DUF4258) [Candidatus Kentron sp. SD]VFK41163.1 MAG: protein of unknown function (DUF4258) [Candidatus Kentron sp. SD]VFK78277.1 MAG: protein of unknown function (DUF4258) [Candidatus Kentron sp. SD]